MAEAKVLYTNVIKDEAGTFTASSEATNYPATNLQTDNISEVWRSTTDGTTPETVVVDLGSAQSISCVALGGVNFTSSATIKIQGHTADSWATPDVDETINVSHLDGYVRCIYHDLTSSASKRYWRISLSDAGNPNGFLEVGEWWIGVPVQFTDNFDNSNVARLQRNNVELRTDYNQAYVYSRDWNWSFDWSWINCTAATVAQLKALHFDRQGNALPFFLVVDPTAPADAYFVRMSSQLEIGRVHYNRYTLRASFIEEQNGLIIPR